MIVKEICVDLLRNSFQDRESGIPEPNKRKTVAHFREKL